MPISDDLRNWITERNEDAVLFDGYEAAIVGMVDHCGGDGRATVVAYDGNKCIDTLMQRDGMDEEEAWDYFSFNTLRAMPHAGKNSPVFFWPYEEESVR